MKESLVTATYLKRKFPNDPKMREVIDFINRSVYYLHQEYLNNGPDPQGEYKWKRNIVDLNVKMVAALGHGHEMHGNLSTILGNYGNITRAYRETIMGSFATDLAGSATLWVPDDRLWEVGKGPDKDHRAFALRQYKNGFMMLANALAISAFSSGGMLPVDGSIQYINKRLQLYFDEIWHDLAFKSELHPAVTIAEDSTDKLEINDNQVLAIKNVIPLSLTTVSPILSTDLIVIKRVDTPYQATVGAFETYFNTKYSLLGHTHIISDIPGLQTALNNKLETSLKGTPNGLAELDANGFVLNTQLPSYVDDVLEFANYASLPVTGESGKIYITQDDNKTYRWSGTGYAIISDTLALGETYATAYRGDRGKIAYDYSQIGHVQLNDTRIANWNAAYSWGNHAGLYKAIGWLPTWAEVTGKPSFFSGDYNDLINKPTIPAAQVNSDWNATSGVAQILNKPSLFDGNYNSLTNKPTLFSGSYTDLTNKPYIPDSYTKTESDGRYSLLGHAHDYLTDAPADNSYYARKNNAWAALTDLNNYPTAIAFTNGNLAVSRYGLTDISVSIDGRYSLLGHTHDYAPASGSGNYIQNQNSSAQSANMWVTNKIKTDRVLEFSGVDGSGSIPTGIITQLDGYNGEFRFWNANGKALGISNTGAATFASTIQATTAKLTNLTDGYIPYHISDASGLGNSSLEVVSNNIYNRGGAYFSQREDAGFYGTSDVGDITGYLQMNQYLGTSLNSANTNPVSLSVNGVEGLRLISSGNVGIGYSSGTEITNNKLAVNGSGYFNGSVNSTGYLLNGNNLFSSLSPNFLSLWDGTKFVNSLMYNNGFRGITLKRNAYTELVVENSADNSKFIIGAYDNTYNVQLNVKSNHGLSLLTNNIERVKISNTGNFTINNFASTNTRLLSASSTGQLTPITNASGFIKNDGNGNFSYIADNSSNWNTAYNWGNHAGLYKAIGWLPTWAEVTGKPSFFSGDYNDLINKPTIPAAQVNSDWNATSGVAQILNKPSLFDGNYNSLTNKPTLFSGSYTDLTNKPYIPDSYTKTESDGRYSLLGHAHDYLTDAPADNSYYARKNNAWAALTDLNNYPTAIAFTNGNLAVSRYGLTDISVPLDGRYSLLGHTHPYLTDSDARIAQWNTAYTHSQTAHQSIINGTGFLKNNGAGTWSYDSNSYALSTHNHAGVYEPVITKGTTAQYFRGDMSLATFPTSLPASDVYAWAKASTKPSYSYSEVGAASSGHNHDGWYDYYGAWILNVNSGANYYVYGYNTVNFIAGSNITLSQSGANITISATGSGSMVYPSAGIAVSTGSAWGTSITNNSANWNTAYNNMGKVYVGTGTTGCVMNGYYFASNISNAVVLNLSTSPTSGDGLPITSGGVYTALAGKAALAGSSSQAFSTANLTVSGTISATGTITGSEVYRGSSRSLKYNIQELTESALSILNATRIHTYNMLADHSFSIGFIAEDTHAWLSGNERKGHIFGNHLGLLTKAIQEEDAKVAELQREIVQLKNEIKILKHGNC